MFVSGNRVQFKYYRNRVNRERKICRKKYFTAKVQHLKNTKPRQWWNAVKRISGMTPSTGSEDLISQLAHIQCNDDLSSLDIANLINDSFLEPMNSFQCLHHPPPFEINSEVVHVSEQSMQSALMKLNPRKACGVDGIPNWLLKEYAEILAYPVSVIVNSSFAEQELPQAWKLADVVPVPKSKPITDINKHLRPISLTPALSKIAEDFIVSRYLGPAVLKVIDPNQFGAIPKSSTVQALVSMFHQWAQATDSSGAAVRVILFDYKKAFDLIDHHLLVTKLYGLSLPRGIARWIVDFLVSRKQRVKLSIDCLSEWGPVPSGVPQGTKLGPWLFLLMINDLSVPDVLTWKYVDDTTIAEVVPKGAPSALQNAVTTVETWSSINHMQLNADKCKELIIDFKRNPHEFGPVVVNGTDLSVVDSAKILGVTFSSNLRWNDHIHASIKKANKRLYFLVLLKRAGVPPDDIKNFYCTTIRPVLEYASPVFHHSLPQYLSAEIERVQKRALAIISPLMSYDNNLDRFRLSTLFSRRHEHCHALFDVISSPSHRLNSLLPPRHESHYSLRRNRKFTIPVLNTERFRNTYIPSMCREFNF